jgi:hypothetical protein
MTCEVGCGTGEEAVSVEREGKGVRAVWTTENGERESGGEGRKKSEKKERESGTHYL